MGWCNYIYQFSYSNKQLDKRQNNITLIDYYSSNCHIYNYETIGYYIYLFFSHYNWRYCKSMYILAEEHIKNRRYRKDLS